MRGAAGAGAGGAGAGGLGAEGPKPDRGSLANEFPRSDAARLRLPGSFELTKEADGIPALEVSGSDGLFPVAEKAIILERLLLSDRCVRRGSMRSNRVSGTTSAPVPPVLPEADADADTDPEADETMLLVSRVSLRYGSK